MFETWIETDLNKLPTVMRLMGRAFSSDDGANLVGVIVKKDGQAFGLPSSGTISSSVILPDGTMINNIIGSKSGIPVQNRASIVLPSSAYSQQGQITVTIKLINGNKVTTLGVVEAYVYPSTL